MATRFDRSKEENNALVAGYEGTPTDSDYVIPSCGIEDLDKAVFNLFDKQIPLFYELQGEQKKIPVIFATGERFAVLRRNKPLTDKKGALILPLISITRSNIDNNPAKGISNNQMFPEVITRRVAKKNTEWRQLNNFEGFNSIKHSSRENQTSYNLMPQIENNIYETIEIPPVKYFGATYEVSIWSSFTQQMNDILTTIMSSYTLNPGQQFRIESEKGYWFPAFVENTFAQETSYSDFTDAERYVKYNMSMSTTGYILAPNIANGKVAIKSMMSSPNISFETLIDPINIQPNVKGIPSNDPNLQILADLKNKEDNNISQQIGIDAIDSLNELQKLDKSNAYVAGTSDLKPYEVVGERSSRSSKIKKVPIKDESGKISHIKASVSSNGEILYDQKYAEKVFNISNSTK